MSRKLTLTAVAVLIVAVVAGGTLMAGSTVFGDRSGTEEPPFHVTERLGERMEVRAYGARVAVETDMTESGGRPFMRLFNYITGANQGAREIAMTVPVSMGPAEPETIAMTTPVEFAEADAARVLRFMLPAHYTMETAPLPTGQRVRLVDLPAQHIAVRRFTGLRGKGVEARQEKALRDRLASTGWTATGPAVTWVFDPAWTLPFMRRNEIAIPVEKAGR